MCVLRGRDGVEDEVVGGDAVGMRETREGVSAIIFQYKSPAIIGWRTVALPTWRAMTNSGGIPRLRQNMAPNNISGCQVIHSAAIIITNKRAHAEWPACRPAVPRS